MFDFMFPKVPQTNADELKNAIDKKENMLIIDIRTPKEYTKGRIKDSINIPLDSVPQEIEKKAYDKNAKIYVYCLSGSRSVYAVDLMVKLGYKNVFDVKSGLLAWRANGYPTV